MNRAFRLIAMLLLAISIVYLFRLTADNRQLSRQVQQLESELGRMPIDDPTLVHLVEIAEPEVPPEIKPHLVRVWQFRCYLPPNYDFRRFSGGGQISKVGFFVDGGMGSSWNSPSAEPIHQLLTVSLQKKQNHLELFYAFGGSSGTSGWGSLQASDPLPDLVVERLVDSRRGSRSFASDAILPLLRFFCPTTAKQKNVAGKTYTLFDGALFAFCPKSREAEFQQLVRGETPVGFDMNSVAKALSDE